MYLTLVCKIAAFTGSPLHLLRALGGGMVELMGKKEKEGKNKAHESFQAALYLILASAYCIVSTILVSLNSYSTFKLNQDMLRSLAYGLLMQFIIWLQIIGL